MYDSPCFEIFNHIKNTTTTTFTRTNKCYCWYSLTGITTLLSIIVDIFDQYLKPRHQSIFGFIIQSYHYYIQHQIEPQEANE